MMPSRFLIQIDQNGDQDSDVMDPGIQPAPFYMEKVSSSREFAVIGTAWMILDAIFAKVSTTSQEFAIIGAAWKILDAIFKQTGN